MNAEFSFASSPFLSPVYLTIKSDSFFALFIPLGSEDT